MGTIKENYQIKSVVEAMPITNDLCGTMFTSYPDLVDIKQLREMLGIGITLAYRLVKNNSIQALKVGREYKIPKRLVILIASFYGLRRSEVLGLKWSAFDFTNNTITIKHKVIEAIVDDKRTLLLKDKTKNKSSYRSLPLIQEIKDALLEHKKKIENNKKVCGNSYMKEHKDYIFVDSVGKIFRPEYITDHFSLLLKKQNLRYIRFHDLRHSCASLLLAKNVPMKAIQEWLGHSTYSTTANLYTHLESNTKNISANVLSEAISF